jgi:hypothetical protein
MQALLYMMGKAYSPSLNIRGKVIKMTKRTEATICILAVLFVLSTIPLDLHIALGLGFIFVIAIVIYKLSQVEMKKHDKVF